MTPDFHPGDPCSIPVVGDKSFLIFIHIFNLVPNSLTAGYYNFQEGGRWSKKIIFVSVHKVKNGVDGQKKAKILST
jgi:hypothetical protein